MLGEVRKGWVLLFAALLPGGMLTAPRRAPLLAVLISAAVSFAYALLGDLSDTPLGFWGTTLAVMVPVMLWLAFLLTRTLPAGTAGLLVVQLIAFGLLYPWLAGLDDERALLYLNLSCLLFLGAAAWQLARTTLSTRPQ